MLGFYLQVQDADEEQMLAIPVQLLLWLYFEPALVMDLLHKGQVQPASPV